MPLYTPPHQWGWVESWVPLDPPLLIFGSHVTRINHYAGVVLKAFSYFINGAVVADEERTTGEKNIFPKGKNGKMCSQKVK
ncbi:hypothetical protein CEXT_808661 [Caerostris extrusa]|uniref:Uncharacterized protein n=1 Tax=Caerostris extrusa TaxID=172846 RepID=A0AAV4M841_CAEEX|nr:hypothetical protein CEXT_808661 [Caerostris extrusa]